MTRTGVIFNALAGVVLVAAVAASDVQRRGAAWRGHQARYQQLVATKGTDNAKRAQAEESVRPHQIEVASLEILDRCTTCHAGHEPGAQAFSKQPFRGHPEGDAELHQAHPLGEFGCTSCHGGQGRSLDPNVAHDRREAAGGWSAFTHPRTRCGRCHPQGGEQAKVAQRGAEIYLSQGCPGCHQPGRYGPGIGPDLAGVGLRGRAYLEKVVLRPDEVYPDTIMPPMRYVLDEEGEEIAALVALLRGFEPWPRHNPRRPREFQPSTCTTCHRMDEGAERPTGRPAHKCPYLRDEASWLRCGRCHGDPQPAHQQQLPVPTALAGNDGGPGDAGPEADDGGSGDAGPEPSDESVDGGEDAQGGGGLEAARLLPPPHAPTVSDPAGSCPMLEQAFSVCGVCHREGER